MGEGMYKTFLGVNVVGHLVCLTGTVIGFLLHQYVPALQLGGGAAGSGVPPAWVEPQLATLPGLSWGGLSLGSSLRGGHRMHSARATERPMSQSKAAAWP